MTATDPTEPPDYPYCGRGGDPGGEDPVGCRGRRVRRPAPDGGDDEPEPYGACLAHLTDADRDTYLSSLSPGSDLHHPGTTFDAALLGSLLGAVHDPAIERLQMGTVDFSGAVFKGYTEFSGAIFRGNAWFVRATFHDGAAFNSATFEGEARFDRAAVEVESWFNGAIFQGDAVFRRTAFHRVTIFDQATFRGDASFLWSSFKGYAGFGEVTFEGDAGFQLAAFQGSAQFDGATFMRSVGFREVTFEGDAIFGGAIFQGNAGFRGATFQGDARFRDAVFQRNARFNEAIFERVSQIGPLACREGVDFSAAVFGAAVIIEVAARELNCQRTRWSSTAALRLRHATVDFSDAVLEYPVSVTSHAAPNPWGPEHTGLDETGIEPAPVRMLSLRGVDAAHLSLTDIELTACRFAGTIHLDQLRLYGRCPMAPSPGGWRRRGLLPVRLTARQTLAEEHYWRAGPVRSAASGWIPRPPGSVPLEPAALVPLYRELRKAFEDGKNEPGAADFYYGEMEMRRHDPRTPAAELFLLHLYWALSGYGLRASRALGWLLGAMAATVLLMMAVGLPDTPAEPYPPGAGVIGKQDPGLHAAFAERFTGARAQKAADVVVNSVVFRSSGQDLTTAGRYTEMASRFTEPVLLGLAALAIRGRVKR